MLLRLIAAALLLAPSAGCREKVLNPDYCQCATCVQQPDGTCLSSDAGGEGEDAGEGEGEAEGEGEGEGECDPECEAQLVCSPDDECVTCYHDEAPGLDPGCTVAASPNCFNEQCILCAETADDIDFGCEADEPICVANSCVRCLHSAETNPDLGCTEPGLPRCDGGTVCRECLENADCAANDPEVICDPVSHECRACENGGECEDVGLGLACVSGRCEACDDPADCGGFGCDPREHVCSDAPPGSIDQCEPCVSDLDCDDESMCVVVLFEAEEVGTYCALTGCGEEGDPDFWCAGTIGRGYSCQNVVPRSGGPNIETCLPAATTCESYADTLGAGEVCAAHEDCGAEGFDDGTCILRGGSLHCSYVCGAPEECPPLLDCSPDRCL